ncbi:2-dehydro-3-deoxyphosphogluconate aldolase/(4S)-4-hydroxy-2-oxoglutarate aldolase [Mobiluncus mulieris]|uniref:2-dehydro-3-deoxy-phosphogluconate aldolase n=1 Tax=Mobiluncus mulieris TaxID=2052 RepID=A0A8G2HU14_9ACTO|nr:bifunctional 4-hydroxy-2-oxoglutarate aldolase/2-dehydro-3-deoxy-phosphogluconate aldolase [Mobiluncus mulieris]MBB5846596.1 2-dehydro-3-deoxyphosphogluconate aldolase/(4S)-4-hydroxy-2-oxoglutarate aldolase [Mobiluncus mulieris]MCV0011759.1 bifunctional 4-hydroxy-2-oxoglutarate aldolase/2-dehydro-3-deoxy-phosphogluconate aldolase [Mobiluncus mulieris]STO16928.1 Putative KHG/KDPG aldolase [Mobiluncus mulieris]
MKLESALPLLRQNPIVPVVVLNRVKDAVPTALALLEGGITSAEVTFRTPVAGACIEEIATKVPDITVGAGTVVNKKQAREAINAGAKFLVSPGCCRKVAKVANSLQVPLLPGVASPTDIMHVLDWGVDVVKFFPAVALGGLPLVKAYLGPFPQLKVMPTGGISLDNMGDWLRHPNVPAVGGSWMCALKLIESGSFSEIVRLSREATEKVKGFRS